MLFSFLENVLKVINHIFQVSVKGISTSTLNRLSFRRSVVTVTRYGHSTSWIMKIPSSVPVRTRPSNFGHFVILVMGHKGTQTVIITINNYLQRILMVIIIVNNRLFIYTVTDRPNEVSHNINTKILKCYT